MSSLSGLQQVANPFSQAHQDAFYPKNIIRTRYVWNNGTSLLPVAKPGASPNGVTPSVIVQTSSPFGWKIVDWEISRIGVFPMLPDWEPDNTNQVLVQSEINFASPQPEPNGQPIFHCWGTYYYALKQPISIRNGIFHVGSQPVLAAQGNTGVNSAAFTNLTSTQGGENPG